MIETENGTTDTRWPQGTELDVSTLGPATVKSGFDRQFVDEGDRVLLCSGTRELEPYIQAGEAPPSFEAAGPREKLFFSPHEVSLGIVTCGGLCPGLNDVIRSIVMTATHHYGVRRILGFRYGYSGLSRDSHEEPVFLEPRQVQTAHLRGGSILGTSRGPVDPAEMVDMLVSWRVNILFAVGGDGTLRGARALAEEIERRHLKIAIVGVPKTIDNDLKWSERSFGFATAVEEARKTITDGHEEAQAAWNGIGLIKLMGRHSGFIAAHAALSSGDVNLCLVPEVPFTLGPFLAALEERLNARHHAVVVVGEGAGQELMEESGEQGRDASGNVRLKDIGGFLRERILSYFASTGQDVTLKYIDPSYTIRSVPANALDSSFCLILGQHAVHAGMAGRTDLMVGFWKNRFTHVPLALVAGRRKHLNPDGEVWRRVMDSTGQPSLSP